MKAKAILIALSVVASIGISSADDSCKQYTSCVTCLNVTAGGEGTRTNCGWCHTNVILPGGITGPKCLDKGVGAMCHSEYDQYKCTVGYTCDTKTGQCKEAPPGQGSSKADCQKTCVAGTKLYKCHTDSYQCLQCDESDQSCMPQAVACSNCKMPPADTGFKCNNATKQCDACAHASDPGCSKDPETACGKDSACKTHTPKPTPVPPPTPPPQTFTCDTKTHTCVKATHGMLNVSCAAQCSNSTPPGLVGAVWRGLEVQKGFKVGEWDFKFADKTVEIKDPHGKVTSGNVAQANGILEITTSDGTVMNVAQFAVNDGDETTSVVFGIGPNGQPAPESLKTAMGGGGNRAVLLNKCKPEKSVCDFSPVFSLRRRLRGFTDTFFPSFANDDKCNQFTNIADCVDPAKTSPLGITCGFCIGAFVQYKDPSEPKNVHCAGFEGGNPKQCICPSPGIWCQGEQCAHGYNCVGGAGTASAKCVNNTEPPFKYRTLAECENGAGSLPACKASEMVKCNTTTKKCDINCAPGSPGCNTKAFCEATCSVQHQKCNHTTHQCTNCDPALDPSCTMTSGSCSTECNKNYNKCDHDSGKCAPCSPKGPTDPSCTVNGCNDAACKKNQTKYACDRTNPKLPVCRVSKTGGSSLTDCNKNCTTKPPVPPKKYWCDLQNPTGPKCIEGNTSKFHVNKTIGYCGDTPDCQLAQYARCNTTSGTCVPCKIGTPACMAAANCKIDCKKIKPHGLNGTYRAIEISKAFVRGEFDFTFRETGLDLMYHTADDVTQGAKWELETVDNAELFGDGDTPGAMIGFKVTKKSGSVSSELRAAGFDPAVGDFMKGIYATKDGENGITAFMYMALSLPSTSATARATSFDDGMTKLEFNMVACKDASTCDFSSTSVSPLTSFLPQLMYE